jgi:hypothetical protein
MTVAGVELVHRSKDQFALAQLEGNRQFPKEFPMPRLYDDPDEEVRHLDAIGSIAEGPIMLSPG